MAAYASGGRASVFSPDVAGVTLDVYVLAGKREASAVVIKVGRAPCVDGVASVAGGGEACSGVIRVRCLLEVS